MEKRTHRFVLTAGTLEGRAWVCTLEPGLGMPCVAVRRARTAGGDAAGGGVAAGCCRPGLKQERRRVPGLRAAGLSPDDVARALAAARGTLPSEAYETITKLAGLFGIEPGAPGEMPIARDAVTGLATRSCATCRLLAEIARSEQSDRPLSVVLIDLDGLKAVNDRAGHEAGDRMLRLAARRFAKGLRQGDLLARWGGDEYLALLPGADLAQAESVIGRLRRSAGGVSFSAGVAERLCGEGLRSLVRRADQAMYREKAGKAGGRLLLGTCGVGSGR